MKKLLSLSMLSGCLFFSACEADTISRVKFGAQVVSKCYNNLSISGSKPTGSPDTIQKVSLTEVKELDISLMPAYAWDPKMLVW